MKISWSRQHTHNNCSSKRHIQSSAKSIYDINPESLYDRYRSFHIFDMIFNLRKWIFSSISCGDDGLLGQWANKGCWKRVTSHSFHLVRQREEGAFGDPLREKVVRSIPWQRIIFYCPSPEQDSQWAMMYKLISQNIIWSKNNKF